MVLLSLKVVKFDTKMYLNFSNFRGRTSAGGGQALVQKRGQVSDGGGWQNFCRMGDPPSPPPGKKNPVNSVSFSEFFSKKNFPCFLTFRWVNLDQKKVAYWTHCIVGSLTPAKISWNWAVLHFCAAETSQLSDKMLQNTRVSVPLEICTNFAKF